MGKVRVLQKGFRISIDLQAQPAGQLAVMVCQVADQRPQICGPGALQEEMPPPSTTDPIDRARGGSDHIDVCQ